VVLDGIPLNANGEACDLSALQIDRLQSIEIVKGSASAYGGASALGGIIYLKSRLAGSAQPLSVSLDNAAGSFGLLKSNLSLEQRLRWFGYRLNLAQTAADNDFPYKPRSWWNVSGDLKREHNEKRIRSGSFLVYGGSETLSGKYMLDWEEIYRKLPGPVNYLDIYKNSLLSGTTLRHNVSADWQNGAVPLAWQLWQQQDKTGYDNTHAANPVNPVRYSQAYLQQGIRWQAELADRDETVRLTALAEASRQTYDFDNKLNTVLSIATKQRNNLAASLRAETGFDLGYAHLTSAAAIRYDNPQGYGDWTSLRAEQTVGLDWGLTVGYNAGKAFCLPSFYDLYYKGDAQSLGNPALQPETSLSHNGWLSYAYLDNLVKLNFYYSEVDNLIQWRQVYLYGTVWKPLNIGTAELTNLELELRLKPVSWCTYSGSCTKTWAYDRSVYPDGHATATYGKTLIYTPDIVGNQELTFTWQSTELSIKQRHTGRQYTTPDNLIKPLTPWTLYGAGINCKLRLWRLSLLVYAQADNLFDRQYEVYDYVPQPGFNWSGGLKITY